MSEDVSLFEGCSLRLLALDESANGLFDRLELDEFVE